MYLSYGKHYIEIKSLESKNEMMNVLSKCEAGHLILGESAEQQTAFYLVTIHLGFHYRHRFGIGICSEEYGLKPHLLLQPELSKLLLGFNHEVVAVGVEDKNIHFRILLDSLFHSFLALEPYILIFHEIGVHALDNRGKKIWEYEADVIEDFEIIGDHLNLTFMDAPPVSLNLQGTGEHWRYPFLNTPLALSNV
jgi:hypothetical protein